ncbi:MAG: hypothetical protein JKY23_04095 [Nitrospinaceae bacterium]|nr:hypothetical protein [Nitrospinaceae bacterium]
MKECVNRTGCVSMRLIVAFRRLQARDHWLADLTTYLSWHGAGARRADDAFRDLCHVEVIFERLCPGRSICPVCQQKGPRHTPVEVHRFAFSVTGMKGRDQVYYSIDRPYEHNPEGEEAWLFWATQLTAREATQASVFLQQQVGKMFNTWGAYANACRWCCCLRRGPRAGVVNGRGQSTWFCSELALAACHLLGSGLDHRACETSPNSLCLVLRREYRFHPCTLYAVAPPAVVLRPPMPVHVETEPLLSDSDHDRDSPASSVGQGCDVDLYSSATWACVASVPMSRLGPEKRFGE